MLDTSIVDDVDNYLEENARYQARLDAKAFRNRKLSPKKLLLRKNRSKVALI